jgi:hypothetical protein
MRDQRIVHLALIRFQPLSATMTGRGQSMWRGTTLAGMACLAAAACASGGRAPIHYAGTSAPAAHPAIAPRPPAAPAPLDLTTIPFEPATAPVVISDQSYSECVPYARNISGIAIWGDAVTWWAQAASRYVRSGRPAPGAVLVLRGYNDLTRGHVSFVRDVVSPRLLRIDHANWLKGGEISLNVPVIDVSPDNDWSQVRVWHIPGGYWGGRAYEAEGFIHPYRLDGASSVKVSG